MIRSFFLFLALFICDIAAGQSIKLIQGEALTDTSIGKLEFLAHDSSNIYCYRYLRKGDSHIYHLEVYSRDSAKLKSRTRVPFAESDTAEFYLENLIIHKDYCQLFYSYFHKKSGTKNLEVIDFDWAGNKIREPLLLDASKGRNTRKAGNFSVYNKEDRKGYRTWFAKNENDSLKIILASYNYEHEKLSDQSFFIEEGFGDIAEIRFDSLGSLYCIASSDINAAYGTWKIRIYPASSNQPVTINLDESLKRKMLPVAKVTSFVSAGHILNFVMPYKPYGLAVRSVGLYWIQVDELSHTLIREKAIPFKSFSQSQDDRDFRVESCIISGAGETDDHNYSLTIESREAIDQRMYGIHVETDYEYGNLITMNFDSALNPLAMHVVYKKQMVKNDQWKYIGYIHLMTGQNSAFLFNDLAENLKAGNSPDFKTVHNNRILETQLTEVDLVNDSIVSKKALENRLPKDPSDPLQVNRHFIVSKTEVFTIQRKGGIAYMVKICLEK